MSKDIFSWFIIISSLVCPKPNSLLTPLSSDPLLLIAPVRSFRFIPDSSSIHTTSKWPLNPVGPTFTTHPGSNHFSSPALNLVPLQRLGCCLACKWYRISNHWMNKAMNARQNILKKINLIFTWFKISLSLSNQQLAIGPYFLENCCSLQATEFSQIHVHTKYYNMSGNRWTSTFFPMSADSLVVNRTQTYFKIPLSLY